MLLGRGSAGGGGLTFAASDQRLDTLHGLQFSSGEGPVVETLRHNEPRRAGDTAAEARWPAFCRAAAEAGFGSCLTLPLRTEPPRVVKPAIAATVMLLLGSRVAASRR